MGIEQRIKKVILKKVTGLDINTSLNWFFGHENDSVNRWVLLFKTGKIKEKDMSALYDRLMKAQVKKDFSELDLDQRFQLSKKLLKQLENTFISTFRPIKFVPAKYAVMSCQLSGFAFEHVGKKKYIMFIEFSGVHK